MCIYIYIYIYVCIYIVGTHIYIYMFQLLTPYRNTQNNLTAAKRE